MKKKELQMSEEQFYRTLKILLEHHEVLLKLPKKHRDRSIKLYGSLADYTLSHFDDFYEFLEHWKDYKQKKWDN